MALKCLILAPLHFLRTLWPKGHSIFDYTSYKDYPVLHDIGWPLCPCKACTLAPYGPKAKGSPHIPFYSPKYFCAFLQTERSIHLFFHVFYDILIGLSLC